MDLLTTVQKLIDPQYREQCVLNVYVCMSSKRLVAYTVAA